MKAYSAIKLYRMIILCLPLLVRRDSFLVLDLLLDVLDGITGLDFQSDSLSGEGFNEDLHCSGGLDALMCVVDELNWSKGRNIYACFLPKSKFTEWKKKEAEVSRLAGEALQPLPVHRTSIESESEPSTSSITHSAAAQFETNYKWELHQKDQKQGGELLYCLILANIYTIPYNKRRSLTLPTVQSYIRG